MNDDDGQPANGPLPQQGIVSDADLSNQSQQPDMNQFHGENVWPWHPAMEFPPAQLPPQQAVAMAHYYEARMRDHAAAYATAAAHAAWAAAQVAASAVATNHPPSLPPAPHLHLPSSVAGYYVDPMLSPVNQLPSPPSYHPAGEMLYGSFGSPMGAANWAQPRGFHDSKNNNDGDDSDQERNGRRRKRQQRMPPSAANREQGVPFAASPFMESYGGSQASEERRGRRRLRSDAGSSGDNHESLRKPSSRRHREIPFGLSSSDGGGSSSVSGLHRHKKKQRQPSDSSLVGKTGVSALHEWCDKRKVFPSFTLTQDATATSNTLFEFAVQLDGKEWGRGRGSTKGAARQDAARNALQNLFPGVVFNDSGILVDLPSEERDASKERKAKSSLCVLDDLAPNLAKSLAIGHDDDIGGRPPTGGRTAMTKRTRDFYPGTSTTSEDDDDNSFYASKGAYVCSTLLHAMVQIDERIKGAPEYSYAVSQGPTGSTSQSKLKGAPPNSASSVVAPRGAFSCVASLRLEIPTQDQDTPGESRASVLEEPLETSNQDEHETAPVGEKTGSPSQEAVENGASDDGASPKRNVKILEAAGTGCTKKEARHIASAKLLALLFPECNGMAEVKAAAEAAREQYAAAKALKLQSKRDGGGRDDVKWQQRSHTGLKQTQLMFALPVTMDPPLDADSCRQLAFELGLEHNEYATADNRQVYTSDREDSVFEVGRRKQLDDLVDTALQALYERDEEGRYIYELSADDVGRTVLRRAGSDDAHWVDKLLSHSNSKKQLRTRNPSSSSSSCSSSSKTSPNPSNRMCPGPSITLLLCRAIAPHEDPPLGCAVLTMGFSLNRGKTLRVAQLANEPHLPKERLIECLEAFASNMKCSLEYKGCSAMSDLNVQDGVRRQELVLDRAQLLTIVESHIHRSKSGTASQDPVTTSFPPTAVVSRFKDERKLVSNTLQSVQEESERSDESDKGNESSGEKRNAKKRDKPSKRSRVN